MATFHVIIPAAGVGARMGGATPKQYLSLLGRPLIDHAIGRVLAEPRIVSVTVVLAVDDPWWDTLGGRPADPRLRVLRVGGPTRADTVLNGLSALEGRIGERDWVLVHDAARPCLSGAALRGLLDAAAGHPVGGILAMPVADTLKRADAAGGIASTVPRDGLWAAQTPQMFRYRLLRQALEACLENAGTGPAPTDEASAVEALGHSPLLVMGEPTNIKVTYPHDKALAELFLSRAAAGSAAPRTIKEEIA